MFGECALCGLEEGAPEGARVGDGLVAVYCWCCWYWWGCCGGEVPDALY